MGRPGYAYGIVGHPIPRAPRGASRGYPAQEGPEVAALPDRPGGVGGSHAAGHDTGGGTDDGQWLTAWPGASDESYERHRQQSDVDGNANSPTVVVDPYDSQKVFAVWGVDLSSLSPVPRTTAIVEGAFSSDGGTNWSGLGTSVNPVFFPDPLTINATPPTAYTQVTDPSVAFDSRGECLRADTADQRRQRWCADPDRIQFLRQHAE